MSHCEKIGVESAKKTVSALKTLLSGAQDDCGLFDLEENVSSMEEVRRVDETKERYFRTDDKSLPPREEVYVELPFDAPLDVVAKAGDLAKSLGRTVRFYRDDPLKKAVSVSSCHL